MTEAEWAVCDNPALMLDFLQQRTRAAQTRFAPQRPSWSGPQTIYDPYLRRKLRLFACGCCRRIWHRLPEGLYREVIVLAEQYADDGATRQELHNLRETLTPRLLPYEPATRSKIHRAVSSATQSFADEYVGRTILLALTAAWEIGDLVSVPESMWTANEPQWLAYLSAIRSPQYRTEQRLRANLVRDVIPSPFRKIEFNPEWRHWRDDTIIHLAHTIYEEHRFDELMILADALEEAGCAEPSIIEHCRQPGPHIRGCWVVDALLEKA